MEEQEQTSFIRVTNREIYDTLRQVEKSVDSMDHRMNAILEENVSLGKRIRALELKTYAILSGLVTTLTAAGAWVLTRIG